MSRVIRYTLFTLYQTPSKFYIQPHDNPEEALVINRQTGEISISQMFSSAFLPQSTTSSIIYGLFGMKHLICGSYLIVITGTCHVGCISGQNIYKVEATQILPLTPKLEDKSSIELDWEGTYVQMLDTVLRTPNFYFSYTYDLTNTLQRNFEISRAGGHHAECHGHEYFDKRFLWNEHLISCLDRCGIDASTYRLPVILGFVSIKENALGTGVSWSLVSRRSNRRAGTRYNSRGIDHQGNVSNFVETEQILEMKNDISTSFVQIRGSIPIFWNQRVVNYKYMPRINIDHDDHDSAMRKHFNELKDIYGDLSIVSLIDQRGREGLLAHEFCQRVNNLQKDNFDIPYHYFDFHRECGNMRWHRLSILLERLESDIESFGFFAIKGTSKFREQTGVVRSNCIDSLDRTNVVQTMIAQKVLQYQLETLFAESSIVVTRSLSISNYPIFMDKFKNVWADNADALAIQYVGTPALKTDFTRTNKRTYRGLAMDGIHAINRYVTNNFLDNYRQDAIDLFLGHVNGYPSPLYRPMDLASHTSTLSFTAIMLTLVVLYFYFRW